MSKVHIFNSDQYGEYLTAGWDVGANCFYVQVDDDDENPSYWKPIIDDIRGVEESFIELGESFPLSLKEGLIDHRMQGVEGHFMLSLIHISEPTRQ